MFKSRGELVVLIVSYSNAGDVIRCLESLAHAHWTDFEVFICENAGLSGYDELLSVATGPGGPLIQTTDCLEAIDRPGGRLEYVTKCKFVGRKNVVRLGLACENLGYGGGINAWLERILDDKGWRAALILNPDTEIAPSCLTELMVKMEEGYGMVGGCLVFDNAPSQIINYGLGWSGLTGRITAIGRNAPANIAPSAEMLAAIDAISGACVLVSRAFVDQIGLMAEDYFLYMEDLDWGRRRGVHKIGFAHKAIVRHACGTSIGSAVNPLERSPLSIYLNARNCIIYGRRWAGPLWVIHFAVGTLDAVRYMLWGAPAAASIVLRGLIDGARGKAGRPDIKMHW